jgi:GT2 family glycosyltransferase
VNNQPHLSVIVPTCSRVVALSALLERLRPERQGLDARAFEVIVSDDAETDPAMEQLRRQFPIVRFVAGEGRGPAANRNNGARYARGEWLVFTDDDCQPVDGWLRAIAAEIAARPLDVVEGKIVAPDKRASIFRRDVENLRGDCFWSANLTVRREFFERIGRFDEDFLQAGGEDLELAHRFRTRGARTAFCDDAVVLHPSHLMTWRALLEFTFRIRWHALYLLKTRQTLPDDTPLWKIVPHVMASRTMHLARTTVRHLRSARQQPAILATVAFEMALFPIVLPYLIYWHAWFLRVRRERVARHENPDYGGHGYGPSST